MCRPAGGAGREMSVWATPWSNPFMRWAFMKRPSDLERVYAAIPDGIDVLVSHQPPYGYGDSTFDLDSRRVEHVRSRELLVAVRKSAQVVIWGTFTEASAATSIRALRSTTSASSTRATGWSTRGRSSICRACDAWTASVQDFALFINSERPVSSSFTPDGIRSSQGYSGR